MIKKRGQIFFFHAMIKTGEDLGMEVPLDIGSGNHITAPSKALVMVTLSEKC